MKSNQTVLLALVLPALVLTSLFPIKRIVVRTTYKHKMQKLQAAWATLAYSPITSTTNFFQQVREEIARRTQKAEVLDQAQKDDLVASVVALLLAYNSRDYDQYKSFRFPIDSDSRARLNESNAKGMLAKLGKLEPQIGTSANTNAQAAVASIRPQDLLRDYYLNYAINATNQEGKPLYCMDCWKRIALDTMRVRINRFTNNIESIAGLFWREHDLNGASFSPTIEFQPTPERIRSEHGGLTSAYFSCVVETGTSVTNHSIYFHWYWDPDAQRWMPHEFRAGFAAQAVHFVF